ncbi:LysR family transcriptional regulator [Rhizobium sp. WYJ-E13]|uniref:LysR family transcriptional regulator n=1 Tax=Rhizobium sp. WYJ-E13 TaxID=2849093 RepID=UPI001C1EBCEB|nr:LysR family transcriptional regulator [Rhizobium sp. WYJ-E13]QWW66998.1 LysR family transcriptional regulator [Rhizobium sp. WYJ-E13]
MPTPLHPNLRHIRLFVACAETGSLTSAAITLGITQPAASQALRRLEELLNATLIERDTMALTAEGKVVLKRFGRLSDLIRQACAPMAKAAIDTIETRLTWPHLHAITGFAEHGSFSAAARMLSLSEPAIQRAAREAEAMMGISLFENSGRNVRLTTMGLSAARWLGLALSEFESLRDELLEAHNHYAGRISIGTLPLTRTFLVPDVIAVLASRYPHARFEIMEGSYEVLIDDLDRGRIDVLVGALRRSLVSKTLYQEPLFDFELSIVGRANHPLKRRREITPDDLADYPWIVARRDTPSRETFNAMAATFPAGKPARQSVETGSLNAIRGVLLKSDHLALLSRHQIRYELEAGFLSAIDYPLPDSRRPVGVTLRRHWLPTALQAEFLALLREHSIGLD